MREDWIECKVESVSEYLRGITYKKENASDKELNGMFPILRANNIKDDKINFDELVFVDKNLINSNQILRKNDILFAMSSGSIHLVGKSAFINDDLQFSFGAFCGVLRPNPYINAKYLSSYFSSLGFKNYISTVAKGSNINNLKREHLLNIQLPIPPLPEQRAIVKKLESLFSSLDAGVADLKKAQQQLKIYRQAVLRKSLDAKKRVLISELIQNLSQGWSPKCLNENVENNEEWAVIKTTAIQHGEFLPYENKKLPTDLEPREQHQIEVGDILITRAGPRIRVGVCCLVRKTKLKLINCDKVYRIKLKDTVVLPEYFELVLNSPDYLKLINDIKTGSSDSGLNLTQDRFLKLEIPLPSVKEQKEIVKQIESRLSVCDSIEQNIKESLKKAEALRQSILKKAFEGNLLTAQELAECKLAPDYEPASVLLEKIKAEQTEIKAKPSKKKPRHSVAKSQ